MVRKQTLEEKSQNKKLVDFLLFSVSYFSWDWKRHSSSSHNKREKEDFIIFALFISTCFEIFETFKIHEHKMSTVIKVNLFHIKNFFHILRILTEIEFTRSNTFFPCPTPLSSHNNDIVFIFSFDSIKARRNCFRCRRIKSELHYKLNV